MEVLKMTRNKVEIDELLGVLEEIRAERYPDIPADLIREIVSAQSGNQDNRAQGRRQTKTLIDDFLKSAVAGEQ
jgi:hypothetical protein